jgi:8-oxo-dGTP pyrophosphatase MutT (NUDIX family)
MTKLNVLSLNVVSFVVALASGLAGGAKLSKVPVFGNCVDGERCGCGAAAAWQGVFRHVAGATYSAFLSVIDSRQATGTSHAQRAISSRCQKQRQTPYDHPLPFTNKKDCAMSEDKKHRNDIYGDLDKKPEDAAAAIPAATVVLLRDGDKGVEVLMLHRTSKVHFGGMWVFPGGRIDPEDDPADGDVDQAARNAAVRETLEEANLAIDIDKFVLFAHWTPPASTPRRYATWFFVSGVSPEEGEQAITVDGHEIQNHEWISPAGALARHAKGEIDLAPPTWITLWHVEQYSPAAAAVAHFGSQVHKVYETHVGKRADGVRCAMWAGDAGYADTDADAAGSRHRLVMAEGGFVFENDVEDY